MVDDYMSLKRNSEIIAESVDETIDEATYTSIDPWSLGQIAGIQERLGSGDALTWDENGFTWDSDKLTFDQDEA